MKLRALFLFALAAIAGEAMPAIATPPYANAPMNQIVGEDSLGNQYKVYADPTTRGLYVYCVGGTCGGATTYTPVAGTTTAIATGGTAITIYSGAVHGGFICNPLLASDQNITTAEVSYINLVTTATANGRGSNNALQPGQCFYPPPQASATISMIAATTGHAFSVEIW